MSLIAITSVNGSPGVTTSALGMALSWPRPTVLVEADPTGSMAIAAGFLRGADIPAGHSIVDLGMSHRQGTLAQDLPAALLPLPGSANAKLLCGPARHTQARVLDTLWEPLAASLKGLESTGQDAIVDAGRLGLEGSPMRLLAAADLCLLAVRSNLPALMAASSWAQTLKDTFERAGAASSLGLLVIDPGRPYSANSVGKSLGIKVVATLPWDPATAQHLSWGTPAPRRGLLARLTRQGSSGLDRSLLAAVETVRAQLATTKAQLDISLPDRVTAP